MSSRYIFLDRACGILIIHMILLHCFQKAGLIDVWLYKQSNVLFFFMPWFFIKSGMFHKQENVRTCVKKGIKRLLVPFMVFTILGHLVWIVHSIYGGEELIGTIFLDPLKQVLIKSATDGNLPLWFLCTLFICKVLYTLCSKYFSCLRIMICAFIIAILCNYLKIDYPIYIGNTAAGLFLYAFGAYIRDSKGIIYYNRKFVFYSCILLYLSVVFFRWCSGDLRTNGGEFPFIAGWYIASVASVLLYNEIMLRIYYLYKGKTLFEKIGKESMTLYCVHWIIINLVIIISVDIYGLTNKWMLLTLIIIGEILILPCSVIFFKQPRLRWMIGE